MTMITEFSLEKSPLGGRNLIEASAGTGKTYTIAGLYLRLILEKGLRVDQILVVTFTEAATEELRDRIRRRLRSALDAFFQGASDDTLLATLIGHSKNVERDAERLRDALACFDEAAIFTIHGFCQRTLQEKAFESGSLFDTELVTDQTELMREIVDDFWRIHFFQVSGEWLNWAQSRGATPEDLRTFAKRAGKISELRVLPQTEARDDARFLAEARQSFAEAASAWGRDRAQVVELLCQSPALNQRTYNAESIPAWAAAFDAYFSAAQLLPLPEKLEKLTTAALAKGAKKGQVPPEHPFFTVIDSLVGDLDALQQAWHDRLLALKRELVATLRRELPLRKGRQNVRAFDDLLLDLRRALEGEGGDHLARELRLRFPAALIDEFQDTDPVQYAIFRTIYPDASSLLFLIGDPKQAIYSFRGADVFAYLAAARQIEQRSTLGTNWRSDGPLVEAVNHLFDAHPQPFLLENISFSPVRPARGREQSSLVSVDGPDQAPFHLWFMPRESDEKRISGERATPILVEAVASEIVRLLAAADRDRLRIDNRALGPGDIAVLVRKNSQAIAMQQALRARGVPSVLYSTENLFLSPEIDELHRILAAVADPANDGLLRTALTTEMLGLSGEDLERAAADEERWDAWVERFSTYHEIWARRGFVVMANSLLAREKVRQRLLGYGDGERRLTNLLHSIEVLHQAALEHRFGMEGLLAWTADQIAERPARDEYQMRLETDQDAVKLVTIHRSKGLEYPIVFCPFGWGHSRTRKGEPVQYHDAQDGQATLHLAPDEEETAKTRAERELLAENLRLLYVALTRARNRCYLVWGGFNQSETSAPAYLFHGEEGEMSSLDLLAERVKQLDDAALRADLQELVAGSAGRIQVSDLPAAGDECWTPAVGELPVPDCRRFPGRIPIDWKIASFSSLVAARGGAVDLPDRDQLMLATQLQESDAAAAPGTAGDDILHFPRGARAGSCLHEIFENLDFRQAGGPEARELVRRKLRLFGFEDKWEDAVHAMVRRVVSADLVGDFGAVRLAALDPAARLPELEFHFPAERISAAGLRTIFARNEGAAAGPLFGSDETLPVRGFVKGFVDLVFRHDGRYYLLDWKSNYLGGRRTDYRSETLRQAMVRDDYLLQYHLYAVALHRLLRARLPGYDHRRHFGGVFYLFLRGIAVGEEEGTGIYYDRPAERLLAELDAFLHGGRHAG